VRTKAESPAPQCRKQFVTGPEDSQVALGIHQEQRDPGGIHEVGVRVGKILSAVVARPVRMPERHDPAAARFPYRYGDFVPGWLPGSDGVGITLFGFEDGTHEFHVSSAGTSQVPGTRGRGCIDRILETAAGVGYVGVLTSQDGRHGRKQDRCQVSVQGRSLIRMDERVSGLRRRQDLREFAGFHKGCRREIFGIPSECHACLAGVTHYGKVFAGFSDTR
jgi:hypothetical protein